MDKREATEYGYYWYLADKIMHPTLRPDFCEPLIFRISLNKEKTAGGGAVDIERGEEIPLRDETLDGYWCKCEFPFTG